MFNITELRDSYDELVKLADPRVKEWLFIQSLRTISLIIVAYLVFVHYGLKIMKNRNPVNLKFFVVLYDLSLVLLSAYIVCESLSVALEENYSHLCHPVDYSTKPNAIRMARVVWMYHVSKIFECLDTVFFIIRGRTHLVTWLHVYHHSSMIIITWLFAKWAPGGETFNPIVANSLVHVVMYLYYALSALGPAWKKFLWWKRYLTLFQMAQFTYGIICASLSILFNCGFPRYVFWISLAYQGSLFALFFNHYYRTHISVASKTRVVGDKAKSKKIH